MRIAQFVSVTRMVRRTEALRVLFKKLRGFLLIPSLKQVPQSSVDASFNLYSGVAYEFALSPVAAVVPCPSISGSQVARLSLPEFRLHQRRGRATGR